MHSDQKHSADPSAAAFSFRASRLEASLRSPSAFSPGHLPGSGPCCLHRQLTPSVLPHSQLCCSQATPFDQCHMHCPKCIPDTVQPFNRLQEVSVPPQQSPLWDRHPGFTPPALRVTWMVLNSRPVALTSLVAQMIKNPPATQETWV